MAHILNDAKWMVKVSLFLMLLQPLLSIRRIKVALAAWNPVKPIFDNLDDRLNNDRTIEADAYFRHQHRLNASLLKRNTDSSQLDNIPVETGTLDSEHLDLVVGIVTVKRGQARYLIQTAARMHELVQKDSNCGKKAIFICNVDSDYERHDDAVYLQQYMNYIDRSGRANFKRKHVQQVRRITAPAPKDAIRRKEIEDYAFCLNVSMTFNSKYVLMLEDDVIPHPDMFKVISYALDGAFKWRGHDAHIREIDHLKLFSMDHLSSVSEYITQVFRNYSLAVLCGISFVIATVVFSSSRQYIYSLHFLMFTRGVFIGSVIVFLVGNSFYLELFRVSANLYSLEPLQRSSTVALIFRTKMLDGLMDYIMYTNAGVGAEAHKDLAIDNYIYSKGLTGYIIKPYIIEHIGTHSSLTK